MNQNANRAFYNEREFNFRPYRGDVKRDAETYLQYMEGFNTAVPAKNIEPLKFEYFKLMSWCFLSPFLARVRTTIREATVTDESIYISDSSFTMWSVKCRKNNLCFFINENDD